MIPIDSIANLALSIDEVCALDSTRLSDPEAFRRFAAGIRLGQDFLANERWAQVQLPPTLSGPYDLVMHEMLPTVYDAAWLESQGGQFAIRITGIDDYTVAAINRRVVVLRGLPTDLDTGAEVIDIEIAPDIFMSFARGLLLDIAEDILEEDDEYEDREVSNAELLLHGMPAGGGLGVPNLPSVEGSLVKLPSNLDFQYENNYYDYFGDNIKKFALDDGSGWRSNDAEGVTIGFEEDFGRPLEQWEGYILSSGNSLLELSPGDGSKGHLHADIIAPRGSVIPFSFDLSARAGDGYSSRVQVLWGGSEVAEPNPGNSTFELKTYNIDLTASGGSDRIEFKASDPDKAGITLDNIKFNVPGDFNVPLVDSTDSKIGTVDGNGIGRGYLARYDAGDTFAVNLQAGVEYAVDIRGFAYGDKSELLNPAVGGIRDSAFNQVANDLITKSDDGKQALFRPTKSGRYYIEAFTSNPNPLTNIIMAPTT